MNPRRSASSGRPQPKVSDRQKKSGKNLVLSNQYSVLSEDEMESPSLLSNWNIGSFHYLVEREKFSNWLWGTNSYGIHETFSTDSKPPLSFTGFSILTKHSLNYRATGGIALLMNNTYLFSEVHLNTPLQAVAANVTLNKVITFCNIYLFPVWSRCQNGPN